MRKLLTISRYEYQIQMKCLATWGVLAAALVIALWDNYPSTNNLQRLEFLTQPSNFVFRIMSLNTLILFFGLMFLLPSRMSVDRKTGVKILVMASPVTKGQYISGKLFGGFLYTFTMLTLFLTLCTGIYYVAAPMDITLAECIVPLIKTLAVCGLPVSLFISALSICLPAVMDIRLFYLFSAALFIINAATVSSADEMPFYLISSGDLVKLIWQHPKFPFTNSGSIQANLVFLVGCAFLSYLWLLLKRKFWRAD